MGFLEAWLPIWKFFHHYFKIFLLFLWFHHTYIASLAVPWQSLHTLLFLFFRLFFSLESFWFCVIYSWKNSLSFILVTWSLVLHGESLVEFFIISPGDLVSSPSWRVPSRTSVFMLLLTLSNYYIFYIYFFLYILQKLDLSINHKVFKTSFL